MNLWSRQIDSSIKDLKKNTDLGPIKEDGDILNFFNLVLVNYDKIRELAPEWAKKDFEIPSWRGEEFPANDDSDFIQWLGIVTAVNACFREPGNDKQKFWAVYKGKKFEGFSALAACVTQAIELRYQILDAEYLARVSRYEVRSIFGRDGLEPPFLYGRTDVWNSVGRVLLDKYGGRFENLFIAADYRCFNNGHGICERLAADFPEAFCDTRMLYWRQFPFYKKALLLPLLYYGRASDSSRLRQIQDIESISPLSDYQLPRILWSLGILSYSDLLMAKVQKYKAIPKNSFPEVAIRLGTAAAVKSFLGEINYHRLLLKKEKINMAHLDFRLWSASRLLDSVKFPQHITMCLDY